MVNEPRFCSIPALRFLSQVRGVELSAVNNVGWLNSSSVNEQRPNYTVKLMRPGVGPALKRLVQL